MIKCEAIFFPKFIHIIFFSTYPHFIHPLYTIIKRSIAYTQNYIAKYKKGFSILKKNFRQQRTKSLAMLGIFTAKWVSNDNLNAEIFCALLRFKAENVTNDYQYLAHERLKEQLILLGRKSSPENLQDFIQNQNF